MVSESIYHSVKFKKELKQILERSSFRYLFMDEINFINEQDFFANKFLLINLIKGNVSIKLFKLFKKGIGFSDLDWAFLFSISHKTLIKYQDTSEQFNTRISERIIEVAEVAQVGIELFGEKSRFCNWMKTPQFTLGRIKPIDLLRFSYGKELILEQFGRINYGVFA